jgi:hypothetical protein
MNPRLRPLSAAAVCFALSTCVLAQTSPPAWNSTTSYKIGDQVNFGGSVFQCLVNETTSHPTPHTPSWDINFVYTGTFTIPVGPSEPFKTITAAWNYIAYARVANNAAIEIKLDPTYSETFSSSFSLDHPYGSKISIVGTGAGQVANFTSSAPGFTLDSGHTLAGLEGLKINETDPNVVAGAAGIQVSQNAVLSQLKNVTIYGFNYGLMATSGGTIDNASGITFQQFIFGGAEATNGGIINFASGLTINGEVVMTTTAPFYGVLADGGSITCPNANIGNCEGDFCAEHGGKIFAVGSTATSPTTAVYNDCYYALDHSFINADNSTATGAAQGYFSSISSCISAVSSKASGYGAFGYAATKGATIDATTSKGGSFYSSGSTDGSYVY